MFTAMELTTSVIFYTSLKQVSFRKKKGFRRSTRLSKAALHNVALLIKK
jgi:hypothetical protein